MINTTYFIILSLLVFIYIVNMVRKKRFSIKESFWWIMLSILMLVLSVFPYSIDVIAKKLGISYPPSLFFIICIIFLLFMNLKSSRKVSELQMKIVELSQELAIIKDKVKKL